MSLHKVLTVLVPAYNVSFYLKRCLESLTMTNHKEDLEILVINDGSTDETKEIAQQFEYQFPEMIRVITKQNGGHGSTINCGIQDASGQYFMVLDGDDWVNTEQFDRLLIKIKELHEDVQIISTNYSRVNMITGESSLVSQVGVTFNKIQTFDEIDRKTVYFALASTCFQTKILKQNKISLQENTYYVDVEYILKPIPYVSKIIFFDLVVYKYFVGNEDQSIHIPNLVKRYAHHDRVMKSVLLYFQNKELSAAHSQYVNEMLQRFLYTHYSLSLVYNDDKRIGLHQAKEFDLFLAKHNADLYKKMGDMVPNLKLYRKYHFKEEKVKKSFSYKVENAKFIYLIKKMRRKIYA